MPQKADRMARMVRTTGFREYSPVPRTGFRMSATSGPVISENYRREVLHSEKLTFLVMFRCRNRGQSLQRRWRR